MKNLLLFSLFLAAFVGFQSCGDNTTDSIDCTGVVATYNSTAMIILTTNCGGSGCHDTNTKSGQLDVTSYSAISAYLKGFKSKFLCSINHESGCQPMPQTLTGGSTKLDAGLIKNLTCWINNNFPE